jgi:hypothetical protein
MANNKAQLNYYVSLVRKGYLTTDQVPEFIRDEVVSTVASLPALPFDPVTQTPAKGESEHESVEVSH